MNVLAKLSGKGFNHELARNPDGGCELIRSLVCLDYILVHTHTNAFLSVHDLNATSSRCSKNIISETGDNGDPIVAPCKCS